MRLGCGVMAVFAMLLISSPSEAAPKETFVFRVLKVEGKKMPAAVETAVRKELEKQIASNPRLKADLPKGAPDPKTAPKKFKAFMQKRKHRAFLVNVEITEFEESVEDAPSSKRGKMVVVRIALRLFGETIPDRTMAFTGDGSATIKLGVGSKVREKDREVARRESTQLAIEDAAATSIKKLDEGAKAKKKKRRRKKR